MINQIDQTVKQFLLKYGHLMLMDIGSDSIDSALIQIVSDPFICNGYWNLYGIEMTHVYWEWMLLPVDNPDRLLINRIVWAQYLNVMLTKAEYQNRKNL